MKKLLILLLISTISISTSATNFVATRDKNYLDAFVKKYTVNSGVIDFGYLIQPYNIDNYNLSSSFVYCLDVKNNMRASVDLNIFLKKDKLKGEQQADISIVFNESVITAGETRTVCLKLKTPTERLKDGVYEAVGAIFLNKTKAKGFIIRYEVISANQYTFSATVNGERLGKGGLKKTTEGYIKDTSSIPSILVDDEHPLAGIAFDIFDLSGSRYIFDENFLHIFDVDKRTTCNFEKKMNMAKCQTPQISANTDCGKEYHEISYENNSSQCYFFFKKKQKGESKLTINYEAGLTLKPIMQDPVDIKLIVK